MRYLTILLSTISVCIITACHHSHDDHGHETHQEEAHEHEADKEPTDRHESHAGEIILSCEQADAAGVEVMTVQPTPLTSSLKVGGVITYGQGDEQTVVATAPGIVSFADSHIADGTPISKGGVIATVSSNDIQDGNPQEKARAEYEAARRAYERAKELVGEKIISQRDYEVALRDYETAKAAYDGGARHATSRGTIITSPLTGFIKNRLVNQGEYVSVGQPIAVVTQNNRVQLRADVPVSHISFLSEVRSANFKMAGSATIHNTDTLHGRLLSYGRSVREGTAYVPVTFECDNRGDMVSGAYADVWLLSSPRAGILSVPLSAIVESMGEKSVFVQVEHDAYMKRHVVTGQTDGRNVEIVSGLKPGEKVVVSGAYEIRLATVSIPAHNHSH